MISRDQPRRTAITFRSAWVIYQVTAPSSNSKILSQKKNSNNKMVHSYRKTKNRATMYGS